MPINLIIRSPFDKDSYAFCAQTGATDRQGINGFTRGIKALGLWPDMVCWPMPISQNIGAGRGVKSLGGLGSYDGLLGGIAPTWGTSGMIKTAGNDATLYVPAIDIAAHGQWSAFCVADFTGYEPACQWSMISLRPQNARMDGSISFNLYTDSNTNAVVARSWGMTGPGAYKGYQYVGGSNAIIGTGPRSFAASSGVGPACSQLLLIDGVALGSPDGGGGTGYANGPGIDDGDGYGVKHGFLMGKQNAGSNSFAVTQAISAYFSVQISSIVLEQIRVLYKQTLGIGLNLP